MLKNTTKKKSLRKLGYISWSAIFGGALVGTGLNFLFNLFALALGISSFSVSQNGKTDFIVLGFLFFILAAFIAMFSTGWVAGRLTPYRLKNKRWGIVIGFLAWSLLLVITIILITNMIQYSAFHANFTSNLVAIKLQASSPMLTETTAHLTNNSPLSFNIETHKKEIVLNALLTFVLFFFGALSGCLGGYLGYKKKPLLENFNLNRE